MKKKIVGNQFRRNQKVSKSSNKSTSKIDTSKQLFSEIVDTLYELNYEVHHAVLLDQDLVVAGEWQLKINFFINSFATSIIKDSSGSEIDYELKIDKLKLLNKVIYERTKIIVQEYGRNHFSDSAQSTLSGEVSNNLGAISNSHDFQQLANPNELIEIRVYKLNGLVGSCKKNYHVDFEHFKGSIFEELKRSSTDKEKQKYIKSIEYGLCGTIDDRTAAVSTFLFLACCGNVVEATLNRFSEIRSFAIIILFYDTKFKVFCMSKNELNEFDNGDYTGIQFI